MALYQLSPALTFEYILASFFYLDEAPLMNFFSCPSDTQCLLGSKPSVVVHTSGPSALEAKSGGAQVPWLPELFTSAFPARPISRHFNFSVLQAGLAFILSPGPGHMLFLCQPSKYMDYRHVPTCCFSDYFL